MREIAAHIVDGFYEDPERIRDIALSLSFTPKHGAMYPGGEAFSSSIDWMPYRSEIISLIGRHSEVPRNGKNFEQGKFRLALKQDESIRPDGVHQDVQKYSGIIYLSKNENCSGGVGLYRCVHTQEISITRKWLDYITEKYHVAHTHPDFKSVLQRHMKDWSNWEQFGELPMRYNRLIILMAHCFHASKGIFGYTPETGRLTQHFEIY
ncbi:DUF6445 family protein [Pseudomonas coronafaciens]|uniref:DUF6445 family protein n=1 Tax=Pseudomonas coronafaciens TaxID=53409 RepID=UPI000EFE3BBE|nr:DUF6445 family protein [Pseudomonas coronafaciens]RMV62092.1 hypothetical protein ALP06_200056 [Pseudomonas coronafaciens pv. atropurpurea]